MASKTGLLCDITFLISMVSTNVYGHQRTSELSAFGMTPLIRAVELRCIPVIKALLEHPVHVNFYNCHLGSCSPRADGRLSGSLAKSRNRQPEYCLVDGFG